MPVLPAVPSSEDLLQRLVGCEAKLQEEVGARDQRIQDLSAENRRLSDALRDCSARLAHQEAEVQRQSGLLEQVASTAEQEIARLLSQLRRCEQTIRRLTDRGADAEQQRDEVQQLTRKVAELETQRTELTDQAALHEQSQAEARGSIAELEREVSWLTASREEEASRLAGRLEAAQFLLEARADEAQKLRSELDPLGEQLGRRTQELRRAEQALRCAEEETCRLAEANRTLEAERGDSSSAVHPAAGSDGGAADALRAKNEQIKTLSHELQASTQRCRHLAQQHGDAVARLRESDSMLGSLRQQCAQLADSHTRLKQTCLSLQDQLAARGVQLASPPPPPAAAPPTTTPPDATASLRKQVARMEKKLERLVSADLPSLLDRKVAELRATTPGPAAEQQPHRQQEWVATPPAPAEPDAAAAIPRTPPPPQADSLSSGSSDGGAAGGDGISVLHQQLSSLQADALLAKLGLELADPPPADGGAARAGPGRHPLLSRVGVAGLAHRAGLREGDALLSIGGTGVRTAEQAVRLLLAALHGGARSVQITHTRGRGGGGAAATRVREFTSTLLMPRPARSTPSKKQRKGEAAGSPSATASLRCLSKLR